MGSLHHGNAHYVQRDADSVEVALNSMDLTRMARMRLVVVPSLVTRKMFNVISVTSMVITRKIVMRGNVRKARIRAMRMIQSKRQ